MVKRHVICMLLCLCSLIGAKADNIVSIGSAEGPPGSEVTVSVSLKNTDAVSAIQLSIPIDENLTYAEGSIALSDVRSNGHSCSAGVKDGMLNIMVYSLAMTALNGSSGELLSFRLKLGNAPVSIPLTVAKSVLTATSGNQLESVSEAGNVIIRCAKAQYSAMEIDYGEVPIRGTYEKTLTIQNVGNDVLTVTALSFSDVTTFSTDATLPFDIAPGSSQAVKLIYSPVVRGETSKTLKVDCNSVSGKNTIRLLAQPFAVNELHVKNVSGISDETVTVSMTMNNMDGINGMQLEFDLPSQLEYVSGSFALSSRKTDHQAVATQNNGKLTLLAYSPSGATFTGEDGEIATFQVALKGRNSTYLAPSKTVLSAVYNGQVMNVCSDVYRGYITIKSPKIYVSSNLNMGATPVTEDAEKKINVINTGSAPLVINRVVFSAEGFSIKETLPLTVKASYGSSNLTVVYNGTEQTDYTAIMQIYTNDPENRMQNVTVTGSRFAPNYMSIDINDIVYHDEEAKVRLSVDTYDAVSGFQFDVTYPSEYRLSDNPVEFSPAAQGMTATHVKVSENVERFFFYSLSGEGIPAGINDLLSLNFTPMAEIAEGTYTICISNIKMGTAELDDKYAGSDMSKSFTVKSYLPGDANGDGTVAVNDVVYTVNNLFGIEADDFVFHAADMNADEQIMINDVVMIVNVLLATTTSKAALAPRHMNAFETLSVADSRTAYGMTEFGISLSNASRYTAMQFDMELTEGADIADIKMSMSTDHSVAYRRMDDTTVRVVVTSLTNEALAEGTQLCISMKDAAGKTVAFTNGRAACNNGQMVAIMPGSTVLGGTTGIEGVNAEFAPADVYSIDGRIVKKNATTLDGLKPGVYVVNGRKVVVEK